MPVCRKPMFLGLASKQTDHLRARRPKRAANRLAMLILRDAELPVRTKP